MEILEVDDHRYYVAVQYHPEYLSRPLAPSPPFLGLVLAAKSKLKSYLAKGLKISPQESDDSDSEREADVLQRGITKISDSDSSGYNSNLQKE